MITLECNYSKKIGLPGYSSHQFFITLRTEIADLAQVQSESGRLYKLLQAGVDACIQEVGYLPGQEASHAAANGSAHGNGNGNGKGAAAKPTGWACSAKQKELILEIVEENTLDKSAVDQLAQELFGKPVRALDKPQASGLIDQLLAQYGRNHGRDAAPPDPAAKGGDW